MALVALRECRYGGERFKVGDEIEPRSARDEALLIKAKWAGKVQPKAQPKAKPAPAPRKAS